MRAARHVGASDMCQHMRYPKEKRQYGPRSVGYVESQVL